MKLNWRAMFNGAGVTILALFGGMVAGIMIGSLVFNLMPDHNFASLNPFSALVAAIPAFMGFLGGSAVWGVLMGRMAQAANRKRMAFAGALGFAPIAIGMALLLQVLEPIAVEQFGAQFPLYRLFTFFFVPTAFIISSISAWAIGIGLQDRALASKLFWQVGLSAALSFLIVNLTMEALGWQVGAPRAAERATMLTVMLTGDLAAAIVGGAVMGLTLVARSSQKATAVSLAPVK